VHFLALSPSKAGGNLQHPPNTLPYAVALQGFNVSKNDSLRLDMNQVALVRPGVGREMEEIIVDFLNVGVFR
jgi:hypothetical protein